MVNLKIDEDEEEPETEVQHPEETWFHLEPI